MVIRSVRSASSTRRLHFEPDFKTHITSSLPNIIGKGARTIVAQASRLHNSARQPRKRNSTRRARPSQMGAFGQIPTAIGNPVVVHGERLVQVGRRRYDLQTD